MGYAGGEPRKQLAVDEETGEVFQLTIMGEEEPLARGGRRRGRGSTGVPIRGGTRTSARN